MPWPVLHPKGRTSWRGDAHHLCQMGRGEHGGPEECVERLLQRGAHPGGAAGWSAGQFVAKGLEFHIVGLCGGRLKMGT